MKGIYFPAYKMPLRLVLLLSITILVDISEWKQNFRLCSEKHNTFLVNAMKGDYSMSLVQNKNLYPFYKFGFEANGQLVSTVITDCQNCDARNQMFDPSYSNMSVPSGMYLLSCSKDMYPSLSLVAGTGLTCHNYVTNNIKLQSSSATFNSATNIDFNTFNNNMNIEQRTHWNGTHWIRMTYSKHMYHPNMLINNNNPYQYFIDGITYELSRELPTSCDVFELHANDITVVNKVVSQRSMKYLSVILCDSYFNYNVHIRFSFTNPVNRHLGTQWKIMPNMLFISSLVWLGLAMLILLNICTYKLYVTPIQTISCIIIGIKALENAVTGLNWSELDGSGSVRGDLKLQRTLLLGVMLEGAWKMSALSLITFISKGYMITKVSLDSRPSRQTGGVNSKESYKIWSYCFTLLIIFIVYRMISGDSDDSNIEYSDGKSSDANYNLVYIWLAILSSLIFAVIVTSALKTIQDLIYMLQGLVNNPNIVINKTPASVKIVMFRWLVGLVISYNGCYLVITQIIMQNALSETFVDKTMWIERLLYEIRDLIHCVIFAYVFRLRKVNPFNVIILMNTDSNRANTNNNNGLRCRNNILYGIVHNHISRAAIGVIPGVTYSHTPVIVTHIPTIPDSPMSIFDRFSRFTSHGQTRSSDSWLDFFRITSPHDSFQRDFPIPNLSQHNSQIGTVNTTLDATTSLPGTPMSVSSTPRWGGLQSFFRNLTGLNSSTSTTNVSNAIINEQSTQGSNSDTNRSNHGFPERSDGTNSHQSNTHGRVSRGTGESSRNDNENNGHLHTMLFNSRGTIAVGPNGNDNNLNNSSSVSRNPSSSLSIEDINTIQREIMARANRSSLNDESQDSRHARSVIQNDTNTSGMQNISTGSASSTSIRSIQTLASIVNNIRQIRETSERERRRRRNLREQNDSRRQNSHNRNEHSQRELSSVINTSSNYRIDYNSNSGNGLLPQSLLRQPNNTQRQLVVIANPPTQTKSAFELKLEESSRGYINHRRICDFSVGGEVRLWHNNTIVFMTNNGETNFLPMNLTPSQYMNYVLGIESMRQMHLNKRYKVRIDDMNGFKESSTVNATTQSSEIRKSHKSNNENQTLYVSKEDDPSLQLNNMKEAVLVCEEVNPDEHQVCESTNSLTDVPSIEKDEETNRRENDNSNSAQKQRQRSNKILPL